MILRGDISTHDRSQCDRGRQTSEQTHDSILLGFFIDDCAGPVGAMVINEMLTYYLTPPPEVSRAEF